MIAQPAAQAIEEIAQAVRIALEAAMSPAAAVAEAGMPSAVVPADMTARKLVPAAVGGPQAWDLEVQVAAVAEVVAAVGGAGKHAWSLEIIGAKT